MFLIRLLLWIVTLPLVIVLYVIRFVFLILLGVGNIVAKFLGGLMFLAGILVLVTGEMSVGEGILGIGLGIFIYCIPYIGAFIVSALDVVIGFVRSLSFG
ncbi:MAG: hypothetical protein IJD47_00810 [Clostridia bacterium]|nr:hypothetical protein [Clostridia bacterium]MBQ4272841.1 hypothetical protein [Clostridia bacterium]